MAVSSPSWNLSRYVRATIVCNGLPVTEDTATISKIEEIASNLAGSGNNEISGYDKATVQAILLDAAIASPYPNEPPAKYIGR